MAQSASLRLGMTVDINKTPCVASLRHDTLIWPRYHMYGTADQTSTMARLAMALLAGFLVVGLFSQTVHNNSHNEQMYVTAGYLLAHGQRLYQDFAFVQTPYSPLVYALAFRLTNGHYLMTAKLVNFAFFATAAILLYAIARPRNPRPPLQLDRVGPLPRQLLPAALRHRSIQLHYSDCLYPGSILPLSPLYRQPQAGWRLLLCRSTPGRCRGR